MKRLFVLFFFSISFSAVAQYIKPIEKDSIPSKLYTYSQLDILDINKQEYADTNTNSVINTNPYFINYKLNIGNLGTPQFDLGFNKLNQNIGFVGYFDRLDDFRFSESNCNQYLVNKAFTSFSYLNGQQDEERFSVVHVQNIKENGNLGFKYQSQNSLGFYQRQRTQIRNFQLFGNYLSKDKKYFFDGAFYFNKTNLQESGGLSNDSLFFENGFSRNLIPVNLSSATNKSEQRKYHFNHYYSLISNNAQDSCSKEKSHLRIFQSFKFVQQNSLFVDLNSDSSYYSEIGLSGNSEIWSKWNYQIIDNMIGLSIKKETFYLRPYLQQQFISVGTYVESSKYQNQIIGVDGYLSIFNYINVKGSYQQVIAGYNSGDGKLNLQGQFPFSENLTGHVTYNTLVARTPFVYSNFHSTRLNYKNSFSKEKLNQISGALEFKNLIKLTLGSGLFNNGVYFDSPFSAVQSNTNDEYFFAEIKGNLSSKRIVWQPKLKYQSFANPNLFPLPEILAFNRFYLKGWLFDHHLHFNLGFDVFYTSNYIGYGYSPLTRQFFLNSSGNTLGNYPFVNVFAAAKVKSARFFVKVGHINQGFTGNNFFLANNYPHHDFSLRLGFSWAFLN